MGNRGLRNRISSITGQPFLLLAALAVLSAIVSMCLSLVISRWLVSGAWSEMRPPMFWETLRFPVLFFRYLAAGSLLAGLLSLILPVSRWSLPGLAMVAIAGACMIRLATPDMALDFAPKPDAFHYALLGRQIASGMEFTIPIGPHALPSRFSPATSLVLALTQWMRPDHLGTGVWAVFASAVLTVLFVYWAARTMISPRAGVVAALLLACSPAYGHYSRQLMSEVPWGLFIILAVFLVFGPAGGRKTRFAGGLLLGLGMLFKPPHVAVIAGAGLVWLILLIQNPAGRWKDTVALALGGMLGLLPWLLYNQFVLGQWLTSGYQIHDSNRNAVEAVFGLRYLFGGGVEKGVIGNALYYPLAIAGLEPRLSCMLFAPPVMLLVLSSLWFGVRQRPPVSCTNFFRGGWGVIIVFTGLFLLYFYQGARFLIPVLPLFCLLLAPYPASLLHRMGVAWQRLLLLLVILCVAAAGISILQLEREGRRTPKHEVWTRMQEVVAPYDVLVTDEDPSVLGAYGLWTAERIFIPLLPAGYDWYGADPVERYQQFGTYMQPYAGLPSALAPYRDSENRILAWVVYPRAFGLLLSALQDDYQIRPLKSHGIPDLYELVPLRKVERATTEPERDRHD